MNARESVGHPLCSGPASVDLALAQQNAQEVENEIRAVLVDPASSSWLKVALRTALERDPVDAASEAEGLAELLGRRADVMLIRSVAEIQQRGVLGPG